MLEVGVGKLTVGEQRAHFALWALLKSPLIIGADLRKIHPDSLAILKAKEVIAVNQDPLGVAGDLIWQIGQARIYAGPLAGGARAVVMLNTHTTGGQYLQSNITVHWRQIGLPAGAAAVVRDLYAERDLGTFTDSFSAPVTAHDVRVLRIMPLEQRADLDSWRPWHSQPMFQPTDEAPPAFGDLISSGNPELPGSRLPQDILAAHVGRRMGPDDGEQFTMVAEA
jgi:alpha-galactosidase